MADKSKFTSSRPVTGGLSARKVNTSTANNSSGSNNASGSSLNARTRPQIRTAPGMKNLLPSKLKPISTGVEAGPMRAKNFQTFRKASETDKQLDDLYDVYLTDFVNRGVMKQMENLLIDAHMNNGIIKVVDMIACADEVVKAHVDKVVLNLWDDLKHLETISGAFDNLLDFAGEETLVEIQTLLVKKFEKITVEGAVVEGSVFKDVEVQTILDRLRERLTGNFDKTKVAGFLQTFSQSLQKLIWLSGNTEKRNEELENDSEVVLEHCSLTICEKARDAYLKHEEEELEEIGVNDEDNEGDEGATAKLDED